MATIRKISVEQWASMCREGAAATARIQLAGDSMRPLIRKNRDFVTIAPIKRRLKKGDIVLFLREDGQYVVHRIKILNAETVQTFGDNCWSIDKPVRREDVCGLITKVERGRFTLRVDRPAWRAIGRAWMLLLPLRRFCSFVRGLIYHAGHMGKKKNEN